MIGLACGIFFTSFYWLSIPKGPQGAIGMGPFILLILPILFVMFMFKSVLGDIIINQSAERIILTFLSLMFCVVIGMLIGWIFGKLTKGYKPPS